MSPRAAVALVSLAAAAAAAGCGSVARNAANEGSASAGKALFTGRGQCGGCHTLADAGTSGTAGPNLDDAFRTVRQQHGFKESTIRDVVRGQIAYPTSEPPSGEPGMPANLVTGTDADSVAAYVASVAGLPVKGGQAAKKTTDGKTIFTTNCGSCHTLADAGTSGTIGPNLDQAMPSDDLAITRVTNGKPPMPSFKGKLTDAQIKAVAKYVSESAGKK